MTVDRIESGIAVVISDSGEVLEIPLERLPNTVHEGSVIEQKNGEYICDKTAEAKLRKSAAEKTHTIFKRR